MSEDLKLRINIPADEKRQGAPLPTPAAGLPASSGQMVADEGSSEPGSTDEAESQMRRALGLLGETQRHKPDNERAEQPVRLGERFNGGAHRRRFVQDGDVPVTVLRRDPVQEAPGHRGSTASASPVGSRVQRIEAALATETAARERAERLLAETQTIVRDLQTKIGHAELAKSEALGALGQEREQVTRLCSEIQTWTERLQDALEQVQAAEHTAQGFQEALADEQQARQAIEKKLQDSEAARDTAEQLVRTLSEETPAPRSKVPPRRQSRLAAERTSARRRSSDESAAAEPEPVKWWLNTKPAGRKR